MLHIVVVMIFPCRFCLVSRWFAWLGGGLTSLKLRTPGVLGIGPCAQLLPNLSHALLTLAVCKGVWRQQVVGTVSQVGRGGKPPSFRFSWSYGPGTPGKTLSSPFTKEDAEAQKGYGLPVSPNSHLLTSVQQTGSCRGGCGLPGPRGREDLSQL